MSIVTTKPQRVYPTGEGGIVLSTGPVTWANPATWTSAFVAAAETVIAGIVVLHEGSEAFAGLHIEVAIGIGADDDEAPVTEVGCFAYYGPNDGIGGPGNGPRPKYPVGPIPDGTRVSVFARGAQVSQVVAIKLKYFEDYDGDIADIDMLTLGQLPPAADMVPIIPNAVAMEPSEWTPLSGPLEVDTDVVALLMEHTVANVDTRWELGKLGTPTPLTMFPAATRLAGSGRAWFAELAGPWPFLAGETPTLRLRKGGTSTTTHRASLMVFRHVAEPEESDGVIGPLLWITMSYRPPVV